MAEIGTRATVTEVLQELPDGRMNIVVEGGERFRIVDLTDGRSYQTAEVEPVDDEADDADPEDVERAVRGLPAARRADRDRDRRARRRLAARRLRARGAGRLRQRPEAGAARDPLAAGADRAADRAARARGRGDRARARGGRAGLEQRQGLPRRAERRASRAASPSGSRRRTRRRAAVVVAAVPLALVAAALVQRDRRLVVREDVQLELPTPAPAAQSSAAREQRAPDAPAPVGRGDHQPRSATWRLAGCGSRATDSRPTIALRRLGHEHRGVRVAPDRAQVAPLLGDAAPASVGDQPALRLGADGARERDELRRVARLGRA